MARFFVLILSLVWLLAGMGTVLGAERTFFQHTQGRIMKPWPVEVRDEGGVLLFSDSPEYVKDYGILYSDVVKGEARVFYYHVNVSDQKGKLAVVLENLGSRPATVTVERAALADGSQNYFEVGKDTASFYMRMPQPERKIHLGAGSSRLLDPQMAEYLLQPQQLGAGMYDFKTTDRVKVSVVFCPATAVPEDFALRANILPKDKEALRGTFKGMNRIVKAKKSYDPGKEGLVYIPIGDGAKDTFRRGVDATDGTPAMNYGNYGILYKLEVPTRGKSPTRMMLSPLGGSYAGAVRVLSGKREERLVHTPAGRLFFGEETPGDLVAEFGRNILLTPDFELTTIGSFRSYRKMMVEYSPPGASNLPVLFILAPNSTHW